MLALTLLLILGGFVGLAIPEPAPVRASSRNETFAGTFAFGAAGDYGFEADGQAVMRAMGDAPLDFILALGDLSYGDTTEAEWCGYFEAQVDDGRALLIAGNHDEDHIDMYAAHCNFGIDAAMAGVYAKEYYFDYPRSGPLVRFILTSCGLSLGVDDWNCSAGDPHYNFLSTAIDGARAASIPWVIVGMHKNCISNGGKDCAIGEDVMDLLLYKEVDLVLQGHEHAYLRSHPLVCADDDVFRPECLAPSGAWGQTLVIVGTGGRGNEDLGGTADEGYFARWNGSTFGFLKVDVSAMTLDGRFVPVNGTFEDTFQITRGPTTPAFTLSANPTSLTLAPDQPGFVTVRVEGTYGFAGTVALEASGPPEVTASCNPSSLQGEGTAMCTLRAQAAGSYAATITATSGSIVRSHSVSLTVVEPSPGGPDTLPPVIAIESPAAGALRETTVTVRGKASDDRGVQSIELSLDGKAWTSASGTTEWSGTLVLALGEQRIHARAWDAAGNNGTAVVRVFVEDPAAPVGSGFLDWLPLPWPLLVAYVLIAFGAGAGIGAIIRRARHRRPRGPPPPR